MDLARLLVAESLFLAATFQLSYECSEWTELANYFGIAQSNQKLGHGATTWPAVVTAYNRLERLVAVLLKQFRVALWDVVTVNNS